MVLRGKKGREEGEEGEEGMEREEGLPELEFNTQRHKPSRTVYKHTRIFFFKKNKTLEKKHTDSNQLLHSSTLTDI